MEAGLDFTESSRPHFVAAMAPEVEIFFFCVDVIKRNGGDQETLRHAHQLPRQQGLRVVFASSARLVES